VIDAAGTGTRPVQIRYNLSAPRSAWRFHFISRQRASVLPHVPEE
jgi:hypothetical protein